MFRRINNAITYIPILLVWEYLFLFLIRNTDWYEDNVGWIDDIDSVVVFFVFFHFLCCIEIYNKTKLIYVLSVFFLIQLQFLYYYIPENVYFLLYLLLITLPIIRTII